MNKEQDYASDTDESDEDFHPDKLAGDSAASEDEEADDSEANGELSGENNEVANEKPVKRKKVTKKQKTKKKSKADDLVESEDDDNDCADHTTSRRATRRTDDSQKNDKSKCLEKDELVSDDEDKSRTNELWADFLKDVNPTASSSKSSAAKSEEKSSSSSSSYEKPKENSPARNKTPTHENLKSKIEDKKIVTEILDFAGEEVRIEREVDASSIKENKAASIPPPKKQPFGRIMPGAGIKRTIPSTGSGSSGGLGSLLNQLGKKKKLSVLEKSQMDWNSFKQTEGIDEQLQTFNKGKDGYLERQDFLQRTDLRQFEIEKNLRQSTRRPF